MGQDTDFVNNILIFGIQINHSNNKLTICILNVVVVVVVGRIVGIVCIDCIRDDERFILFYQFFRFFTVLNHVLFFSLKGRDLALSAHAAKG